ncbi:hypothetical protein HPB47_003027, partial [Ixodes persulcatus]
TVSDSHTSLTTTATAIAAARPATSPRVRRVISKTERRVAPRLLFLPAISGEAREPRGFPGDHVTVPLYGAPALAARDAAVDARSSSARPARPPPSGKDSGGQRSVGICRQPRKGSGMARVVRGVNLDSLEDEFKLMEILDATEDFEERKVVRSRLQEVKAVNRAKREALVRNREQERENSIKQRQQEAAEHKQRTLAMYDKMAKSAPAGGVKHMDLNILRDGMESSEDDSSRKVDLVEDAIKQRQMEADLRKKRILAAYDAAAKSGPAGTVKTVDFDSFKKADVSGYEPPKPTGAITGSSTFSAAGGVPKIVK